MFNVAVREPVAFGVNVTLITHVPPAGITAPLVQVVPAAIAKLAALVPVNPTAGPLALASPAAVPLRNVNAAPVVLVNVTVVGALGVFNDWLPNDTGLGENVPLTTAIVSVSFAWLFAVFESVTPAGAVIVTVLVDGPVGAAVGILPVSRNVAVPPFCRLADPARVTLPVPVAVQVDPADVEQVHDVTAKRVAPGNVSDSVVLLAVSGPLLVTTIV